ncbi:probable inactive histone-lysine N-methyltransferase SUVR2 isoform X1 [Capsicum annuum]|uniref:probable inactive histone-lysine N-methyltransferase SUVR2 isoform X1 n=1 Tax=Capsicum annuum TaxID=4072 RepID=UPI001FB06629|nr:probable inactive histone-lysine N-methyltransferase SUVR2 isoform X1 [Capsicum annuum]XP_016576043.2 probable inactive histone-lysine N-methyltransferase SUVR2 isoform X1 [Capsicum annuum]
MPPNPRVDRAFRAMKTLGIPGDKVKPVLKNLLRLYNKNWDLIEAENYRALADAIFESDEAKDSESTKPTENVGQEALVQDEPEPLLKRQRLKNQSSQPNESVESHLQNQSLGVFDSPQAIGNESLGRNKGKQPILSNSLAAQEGFPSSQPSGVDKSLSVPRRAGSTSGSAIPVSPTKNVIANHTFIKPKDEPVTDDLPHLEVPLAVTRPGSSSKGKSPVASGSSKGRQDDYNTSATVVESDTNDGNPPSPVGAANSNAETNTMKSSPSTLEIASSQSGEVKIVLNYGSVLGKSDFHMPTLDAVVKLMEDKCLKGYKELDPTFSVMKVMTDVCQCFWEMGSESTNKSSAK